MQKKTILKSVVVTGATAGIGYQTALDFASEGAFVIGVGRNSSRCADAQRKLKKRSPTQPFNTLRPTLSSQKQVRELSIQINRVLDENQVIGLDVLVITPVSTWVKKSSPRMASKPLLR